MAIVLFKLATDTDGYQKGDEVFNVWYVIDMVNFALYITFIYLRLQVITKCVCNPVFVPANSYLTIFEDIYETQQTQLTVNFISILIGIGRFFKYYTFQPRLQIVNLTLASSAIHLFHFCVVFLIMLFGFALIGHLNFGSQIRDFSTWANALQVMWESLFGAYDLGPTIGNSSLSYVDPIIASLFFYIWTFLTGMILMNIFVAILMDGYAEAVDAGKQAAEAAGLPGPDAVYDDVLKAASKTIKKLDKRSWVYTDHALLSIMLAIDEETHDPVTLHSNYKLRYGNELEELKEDRERIQERIEFLETLMTEDIADQPFHLVWQEKSVSYIQIAERFANHPALEKHGVLLSDVQEIYDSAPLGVGNRAVRYVEKLEHQEEGTHIHVADADENLQKALHDGLRKRIKELMLDNTLLIKQHMQLLQAQADAARVTRNDVRVQGQLVLPVLPLENGVGGGFSRGAGEAARTTTPMRPSFQDLRGDSVVAQGQLVLPVLPLENGVGGGFSRGAGEAARTTTDDDDPSSPMRPSFQDLRGDSVVALPSERPF
jgi:uncharacterized spore protein YtfJ